MPPGNASPPFNLPGEISSAHANAVIRVRFEVASPEADRRRQNQAVS